MALLLATEVDLVDVMDEIEMHYYLEACNL